MYFAYILHFYFPFPYPSLFYPLTLSFVILCHSLFFLFTEITSLYRSPLLFLCQYPGADGASSQDEEADDPKTFDDVNEAVVE